jgi:hypothetical protein
LCKRGLQGKFNQILWKGRFLTRTKCSKIERG